MKRIGIYVGKNLLRIILLLFAVSILTFALVSASPIDPLQANVGQAALGSMSEEQKEKLRSYWGVDEPPVQRYLNWLNAFIKGDGGISLLYRQSSWEILFFLWDWRGWFPDLWASFWEYLQGCFRAGCRIRS